MINILVVEDNENLNRIICKRLTEGAYMAKGCLNADDACDLLEESPFDLIISDIMMPKMDGFEFAKIVRETNKTIPILFVTSKDDIMSKKKGFKIGIDDYMVKPVNLDEMLMRVGALLRRANIMEEKKITAGNLTMDEEATTATVDGKEIALTLREFKILYKLLSYPKKTFSRSQLMEEFWDIATDASLRAVDIYITKLREKFSSCDGFQIVTVRGLGYKAVLAQ